MTEMNQRFYGKYRGTVLNNVDPMQQGRIMVTVPGVLATGVLTTWAMPCLPFAGMQAGCFMVPPLQSGVWVEFEKGELEFPIWVGGYWANAGEVPAQALAVPPSQGVIAFQTQLQNLMMLSDTPGIGGFRLMTTSKAMIEVNDTGITISNGKGATIMMNGNTVTINNGALVVT